MKTEQLFIGLVLGALLGLGLITFFITKNQSTPISEVNTINWFYWKFNGGFYCIFSV